MIKIKRAFSFGIIGLMLLSISAKADDLLPTEPEVSFFYPPYAKKQPVFDDSGILKVNLGQAKGKNMALLKVVPPSRNLKNGQLYAFKVSARSSVSCPVILNFPQPDPDGGTKADGSVKPKSSWNNVGKNWKVLSGEFTYDSSINDGNITLFWTKAAVKKGSTFELKKMEIFPMD